MSEASLLKTLTLNTATKFNTSAAIDRVQIHNDSSFYLRVYFGADAPTDPNGGGWHDTIGPGDHPLLWVVGASAAAFTDRTNYIQSTPYVGVIIVMPFLPINAPLPNGGVITGASVCFLTGYYPHEFAEGGNQVEAFVQAAKQGRFQEIHGGAARQIGTTTDATVSHTRIGASIAVLTPTLAPNLYAANAVGTSTINVYVYAYFGIFQGAGAANATSSLAWHLEAALMNAAETIVRTSGEFGRYVLSGVATTSDPPRIIADVAPVPMVVPLVITQGTLVSGDHLNINFVTDGQFGNFTVLHNVLSIVDLVNQTPIPAVPFTFPAIGFATPFSTFNPQTF